MKSAIKPETTVLETYKLYTPEEILAAGGTMAFGLKRGNNNESLIAALESSPAIEPFTDEEWNNLMADLKKEK